MRYLVGGPNSCSVSASVHKLQGLSTLIRLEQLSLAWNVGVTDDVVEWLCFRVKGLRDLDLSLCAKISLRSIKVTLG